MPQLDYNRYALLNNSDGTTNLMPVITLPSNASDKYESWTLNSRMDKFANKYFGSPFYDFLIMIANPQYISEWDIEEGTVIRIPFPLSKAKSDYENALKLLNY